MFPSMSSGDEEGRPPAAFVFWVIWFAIFNGLFIIMFFVGGGFPKGQNEGEGPLALVAVAGVLALASMAIRFLVIPRMSTVTKLLQAMLIGLALAEAVGIIGIVLVGEEFPETRLSLFVTAVSAVAVYAPFYVHALLNKSEMR